MTDKEFQWKWAVLYERMLQARRCKCKRTVEARMKELAELRYMHDGTPVQQTKYELLESIESNTENNFIKSLYKTV